MGVVEFPRPLNQRKEVYDYDKYYFSGTCSCVVGSDDRWMGIHDLQRYS